MSWILCWLFGCKVTHTYLVKHEHEDECPGIFPEVELGYCCRCGDGPIRVR